MNNKRKIKKKKKRKKGVWEGLSQEDAFKPALKDVMEPPTQRSEGKLQTVGIEVMLRGSKVTDSSNTELTVFGETQNVL
jgi:hypothetical protein